MNDSTTACLHTNLQTARVTQTQMHSYPIPVPAADGAGETNTGLGTANLEPRVSPSDNMHVLTSLPRLVTIRLSVATAPEDLQIQ